MGKGPSKSKDRRQQVREKRARSSESWWSRAVSRVASWPVVIGVLFAMAATTVALLGEETLRYSVGERIHQPIYAKVEFRVLDAKQTSEAREASRAKTPDYFKPNDPALSIDRISKDLWRLYQMGADADTYEVFEESVRGQGWEPDKAMYDRLRSLLGDVGRERFAEYIDKMKLAGEYVVRDKMAERRTPGSTAEFVRLWTTKEDAEPEAIDIPQGDLVSQASEKELAGSASRLAKSFPYEFRSVVEAIVLKTLRDQPTIIYDQERTVAQMQHAADAVGDVLVTYEKGQPLISPHTAGEGDVLTTAQYELLKRHRTEYLRFLEQPAPGAVALQEARLLRRVGLLVWVALFSLGLFLYAGLHHGRVFEVRARTMAIVVLLLGMLLAGRLLDLKWSHIPGLVLIPCLTAGSVMAIAYPRRFAMGVMAIAAVLVTITVRSDFAFFLTLVAGLAVTVYLLEDIRTRTKIIGTGVVTALGVGIVSASGAMLAGQTLDFVMWHAFTAGGCVLLASFFVSGILPFIERVFRIATSLTLLEWTDSRNPLLQLLVREAPGTYNHSQVLGTLAKAACERIGANGLLAQVGALYHDIGKIHKGQYYAENQEGRINRHDNLAPTMSLLIILAHVKDGIEMAKEYKLPRVLHQFIEEHHGTTVVRYFYHAASQQQGHISSGKHDRQVSEAEFRYAGPKPQSKESAVLMVCDSVEGAVRSLSEPTAGRIESTVHQILMERLNDGQFDDCDITLKELSQVEDSLVKSLCSLYHGRIAYPKARKTENSSGGVEQGRVKSVAG